MNIKLLKPKQVDCIFNWPFGKAQQMFKQGTLPGVVLPDNSLRFEEKRILSIIHPKTAVEIKKKLDGNGNGKITT